ncbi:uncharacterized protein SCHCODRAFT_01352564 [Schizophyllum commune H4-8]|nr:uncharacterized protein SCHCODRAFT_01352564 [Schizophyllum commune H4-8]KAI5892286.1 hypothetical protein SCHCODRAFT_01352564 [Schizophyllum commune H4-8]
MSTHILPSRSSLFTSENGSSAPIYTAKPLADEVTLESASICGPSPGDFERTSGPLALRLHDQIDGVSRPTIYHKHRISGAALIQSEECSSTTKVALKFEGALTIEIDGGVSQTISFLSETHVVWQAHECSSSPPSQLPFTIELTPEFADKDGRRRPLPPTCNFSLPSPTSLRARASYTMTLTVDRRRKHGVLPRSKSPSLSIPFDYVRRSKPHLPMRVGPASDAALWFHQTSQIDFKTPTTQPLLAKLSIPAAKVYWIGHSIAFHFTLAGPSDALRSLFPEHGAATVSVSLIRQVVANVRKVIRRGEMVLGEGTVRRIADGNQDTVLRWEGEVRVSQPETVPAFDAGALLAKDFIVAEITPPIANPAPFDMPPQRIPIFIRLTTDKHEDDP